MKLPLILITLILIQQGFQYKELCKRAVSPARLAVYHSIPKGSVVLTTGSGIECQVYGDCWSFAPSPQIAEYVCSASNEELTDRWYGAAAVILRKRNGADMSEDLAYIRTKYRLDYLYDYESNTLTKLP